MQRSATVRGIAAVGVLLLTASAAVACGSDGSSSASDDTAVSGQSSDGSVAVADPWVRSASAGGNGAVYFDLTGGSEDDALVSAAVDPSVATETQLHQTMTTDGDDADANDSDHADDSHDMGDMDESDGMDDGASSTTAAPMMTMEPVESVDVAAGATVSFAPGGYHVMLLDLQEDLVAGDAIEVTLTFDSGHEETVTAEVRDS